MKRDLDLARQLLLDIENRGADCSVSVLRTEADQEAEEKIRYHLRLLIDAGWLKEIDRTSEGIPCVRLTHDGHELLELARNESRWREAKWVCQEYLGGLSLTIIRSILIDGTVGRLSHARRPHVAQRQRYESDLYRQRPAYRFEPYRYLDRLEELDGWDEENVRYVRVRPECNEFRERGNRGGIGLDGDGRIDMERDAVLPPHII